MQHAQRAAMARQRFGAQALGGVAQRGAQRFVPAHQRVEGQRHRRDVDRAVDGGDEHQMVRRAVQGQFRHPHRFLAQRHRGGGFGLHRGVRLRVRFSGRRRRARLGQHLCQRRAAEQIAQRHVQAVFALQARGQGHVARQLDRSMIDAADLVLTMEPWHSEAVLRSYPHARGKTYLLGKWLDNTSIPDPYRQSRESFERAYQLIESGVNRWKAYF